MSAEVRNGRKVEVELSDFRGTVGVQETVGGIVIAYRSKRAGRAPRRGDTVTVEGSEHRITSVSESKYVAGMTLVELAQVAT